MWSLTAKAKNVDKVDPQEVVRFVRAQDKKEAAAKPDQPKVTDELSGEEVWKQQLHTILTQKLSPAAFERLVQLMDELNRSILNALESDGPIPRQRVRGWIHQAANVQADALLYQLTHEASSRS